MQHNQHIEFFNKSGGS